VTHDLNRAEEARLKRKLISSLILCLALIVLSGMNNRCAAINILSRVKGMVSGSDKASPAQLDSLAVSGGKLAAALKACPQPRRGKLLNELALAARQTGLSIRDCAALWDTPVWENRVFEDFWEHASRSADEERVCDETQGLTLTLAARPIRTAPVKAVAFSAQGAPVLLDSSGVIFLERAADKDSPAFSREWKDLAAVSLDEGAAARISGRRLIIVQREREMYDMAPVLTPGPLVFSAGLEQALQDARTAHGLSRGSISAVCLRDDSGLLSSADSSVLYWERLENGGAQSWVLRSFAFRDIETVFLDSRIRDNHAAVVTVSGVLDFGKLDSAEKTAFRTLKRDVEAVSPRASLDLGGLTLDDRYFLHELPEAVECLSSEVPLEKGEVVLALASSGTARLDRESLKSLGLSAGNLFNLSGAMTGVAGRLGNQVLNLGLKRISFAAVTDRRFILYRNGEIKTYALAEGMPFALKKDKVLASGVDFYARDFFEEGKPLLEDVHESLSRRFLDASKKIVSGNYDFSIAADSSRTSLSADAFKARLDREKNRQLGQASETLQEKLPSGELLERAKETVAGAFNLKDNEKGYAGMLRSFLKDKTRENNAPLLDNLRLASQIAPERAVEIERRVRRELGLDLEVQSNEMGFVGMLRQFKADSSLARNTALLESLAAASGISAERARALTAFVTGDSLTRPAADSSAAKDITPPDNSSQTVPAGP
jgi:hypothetical protein